MTATVVDMFDATGSNFGHLPQGQVASYVTGSEGVPASAAQLASRPGIMTIAQSPVLSTDETVHPDFIDYENGAVTMADLVPAVKVEQAAFRAAARPGQRWPGVYCSASNVTPVVNQLIAGGVTRCPLGVADYSVDEAYAESRVAGASGPFPVVWYQYDDNGGGGTYDRGKASLAWLNTVAGGHPVISDGAAGAVVVALQEALNDHGAHLSADGDFGPATLAALKSFQAAQHLTADGVCGPLTWARLA
jgi:peptidoglycan hydrolase-like protein with peptidoglycan-binding domain